MKKILYITPHLSTGGLPQYLLKKIELLNDIYDIYCIEYVDYGVDFIVQKSAIKKLLGKRFFTLDQNKNVILNLIKGIQPDIIHFEEIPESFIDNNIIKEIYSENRKYVIIETTHSADYTSKEKTFMPDKFSFVSQLNYNGFKDLNVDKVIIEYDLEKKERSDRDKNLKELKIDPKYVHILNVGLFTPGKNQSEIFELAKQLPQYKFHFVGNQAGNFQNYWEPLMKNKPANCIIWGERKDVDKFYSCMDLFLFTSKYENNPIVIKEALSWNMPVLMRKLDHYGSTYDNDPLVTYLTNNIQQNVDLVEDIIFKLKLKDISHDVMTKWGKEQAQIDIKIEKEFNKHDDPGPLGELGQPGINTPVFITHTTENYFNTTKGLIDSLLEFSKKTILLFTVNFNTDYYKNNSQVITCRYDTEKYIKDPKFIQQDGNEYIDRSDDSIYNILTLKPYIILKVLNEYHVDEGVYLDGDMIARTNIDDLFDNLKNIDNYPLVTRGVFSIMLGPGNEYFIERHLMEYLNVKNRGDEYVQTNTIAFNKNCKKFIEEWRDTCNDDYIRNDWRKLAPYHEETIINVLFWKYNYTKIIPLSFFNVKNIEFIKAFEEFDDKEKIKYSELMKGFRFVLNGKNEDWSWIPYNKNDVKTFHGLKDYDEIKKAIQIIKDYSPARIKYVSHLKQHDNICVVMINSENYKPLGDIAAEVNKKYADKHGYDFIYQDSMIDKNLSVYWQKPLMIRKHIKNYDWIFYIDSDSMIMNHNIKLESLIDEQYDIIMSHTMYCTDFERPEFSALTQTETLVNASHILIKNSALSIQFLDDIISNNRIEVPFDRFDFDNRAFRMLITHIPEYRKATKILMDEKLLNSVWPMNIPTMLHNFKTWNDNDNIYREGNFTIHVVGYPFDERIKLMNEIKNYVNYGN